MLASVVGRMNAVPYVTGEEMQGELRHLWVMPGGRTRQYKVVPFDRDFVLRLEKFFYNVQGEDIKILNLGCGNNPIEGAINHDLWKHAEHVHVAHDLNNYPWPWGTETVEEIYALDVLEHLNNLVKSLEECHRILKADGILHVTAPYAGDVRSHRDPTHRWFLTPESLDYFIRGTDWERKYGYYSQMRWDKENFMMLGEDNMRWQLRKLI
jgi:SAM-dependent methyltransferase